MIQLTPQQIDAVTAAGDVPPMLFDPSSQTTYVLLRKETYEELTRETLAPAPSLPADVQKLAAGIDWDQARKTMRPAPEWFDGDEPKPF